MAFAPEVRRLRAEEWSAFRDLRLEALKTDPLAFGSTYARELEYPDAKWRSWAREGAQGAATPTFVADSGHGVLVGMVGLFRRESDFIAWGLWVAPTLRRRKLGGRLMEAILNWFDASFPGERLFLQVNPSLTPAVRIYLTHGFEFTGKVEPVGHDPPAITKEMVRQS